LNDFIAPAIISHKKHVKYLMLLFFSSFPRYGLKEFLVLSPSVENVALTTESRCHLLLSSVSMALANSKW
jgi:hypothetical protein